MYLKSVALTALLALVAMPAALTGTAKAAEIKCDTIRMVVPWKAGGGTDRLGRGLASAMEKQSKKSIIVDNIDGASSATGSIKAVTAAPDGCTVLMNGDTEMVAFMTFKSSLPFKVDQMKFVGGFFTTPTWMLSHKDRGYKTFEEFAEAARKKPGELTIGTGGASGAHMVMAAAIKGYAGLDVRIVPYSGGADLQKALLANQVDAGVIHSPILLNEVKAGMINVLATGGPLSDIQYEPIRNTPTLESLKMPIKVAVTRGVFVPKDTPDEIVAQLAAWIKAATEDPEFIEFGKKFGFPPVFIPGPEFEKSMRDDVKSFKEIYDKYIKAG
ncbi:MAG: tripartite tricarboxylate transporter substrate binding protein [Hyphomicrobiales bacterium]